MLQLFLESRRLNLLYFILILLFFTWGCSSAKQREGIAPTVDSSEASSLPPLFPHSADWTNLSASGFHGNYVMKNGKKFAPCLTCHKVDSEKSENPPTCHSCHAFPHPEDWVKQENHGKGYLAEGRAACATNCHGKDLKGGLSKVACNQCHALYPHYSKTWRSPTEHGSTAKGNGKLQCRGCHGEDYQGGDSKVSCLTCHGSVYPHKPGWKDPTEHGLAAKNGGLDKDSGKEQCRGCHGDDFKGGISGVSCYQAQCHTSFPHDDFTNKPHAGWRTPAEHGAFVLQNGSKQCGTLCHGTNLKGGLSGISCFDCHTQKVFPHSDGWNAGTVHGPEALQDIGTCKQCHGGELDRSPPGYKACKDCHATFAEHEAAQVRVSENTQKSWEQAGRHGDFVREVLKGNSTECRLCHGQDYLGGISGKSCKTCHSEFPHPELWNDLAQIDKDVAGKKADPAYVPQFHGKYYAGYPANKASDGNFNKDLKCRSCHGEAVQFSSSLTRDALGAKKVNTPVCYTCHLYPHVPTYAKNQSTTKTWYSWHYIFLQFDTDKYLASDPQKPLVQVPMLPQLLVDSAGNHPQNKDDPILTTSQAPGVVPAVLHSCGGSSNSCHFNCEKTPAEFRPPQCQNGKLPPNAEPKSLLCTGYCHTSW